MSAAETHLHEQAKEHLIVANAAKAAPPVAVSGAHIMGYPVSDIVLWLTALYLCLQITYLGWKWISEYRAKNKVRRK